MSNNISNSIEVLCLYTNSRYIIHDQIKYSTRTLEIYCTSDEIFYTNDRIIALISISQLQNKSCGYFLPLGAFKKFLFASAVFHWSIRSSESSIWSLAPVGVPATFDYIAKLRKRIVLCWKIIAFLLYRITPRLNGIDGGWWEHHRSRDNYWELELVWCVYIYESKQRELGRLLE